MGRRNKCKPRMIPQQDRRICGSICFCQLIVVFSCVSIIYLTVAIYIPSYRAFNSGFETTPVMCQTINKSMLNNCSWASCGEWCLTKTSGFCPQIHVTTRQNGTNLYLQNCTSFSSVTCPEADPDVMTTYNCNNGTECSSLFGVFNCSLGHCANMTQIYKCHHKADGFVVDNDRDNTKLNGFFECKGSKCTKIKRAFTCDRICPHIIRSTRNVLITLDNTLYMGSCKSAMATTQANGNDPGFNIEQRLIWEEVQDEILMLSCHTVEKTNDIVNATDCINGTIFNETTIPKTEMNFTTFWSLANKWQKLVDPHQQFLPMQSVLTIYNNSNLYINLEGCVNTLRGECRYFLQTHGHDGRNQTAQSRFTCFYNKNNSGMVISRYDLDKTWKELIISATVPTILFIVSFITLCVITHSVKVGDDTKMRCKYCIGKSDPDITEMTTTNSKYEVSSPSDAESNKRYDDPLSS